MGLRHRPSGHVGSKGCVGDVVVVGEDLRYCSVGDDRYLGVARVKVTRRTSASTTGARSVARRTKTWPRTAESLPWTTSRAFRAERAYRSSGCRWHRRYRSPNAAQRRWPLQRCRRQVPLAPPRRNSAADDEGDVSGGCYLRGGTRENPRMAFAVSVPRAASVQVRTQALRFRGRICPGCCLG